MKPLLCSACDCENVLLIGCMNSMWTCFNWLRYEHVNVFWLVKGTTCSVFLWFTWDLTQLGRERRRRRLLKFELPVFPFLVCIAHSFLFNFAWSCVNIKKLETLILNPNEDWNDSCFVVYVLWKLQKWAFQVLFTKEDDGKVASWLHSHVKPLYFVIKSIVFWRSRRRSPS